MTTTASILVNFISAIGLFGVCLNMRQAKVSSVLSTRIIWLTGVAGLLCGWRVFSWSTGYTTSQNVELVLAAALPLLLLISTEGVLRRHAHWAIKVTVAGLFVAFAIVAMIGHQNFGRWYIYALPVTQIATIGFCLGWLLLRNRADRSSAENQTANVFTIVVILAATLFVTDYAALVTVPVKLGALGFLMAGYFIAAEISPDRSRGKLLKEVLAIVGVTIVLITLAVSVFGLTDVNALWQLTGLLLTLFLTTIILLRYFGLRVDASSRLEANLLGANTDTLDRFLGDALKPHLLRDTQLVSASSLDDYDLCALRALLTDVPVFSLATQLDPELRTRHVDAVDQLNHLLQHRNATHVTAVANDDLTLLLASLPGLGERANIEAYLAMISKMGKLISQRNTRAQA